MITKFAFNFDRLQRMNGQDPTEIHGALLDWLALAKSQRDLLWDFYNLVEVLTVEDVPKVKSARMMIIQIRERVHYLEGFFAKTPSVAIIETSRKLLDGYIAESAEYAEWLLGLPQKALEFDNA